MKRTDDADWKEPLYLCALEHLSRKKVPEVCAAVREFSFLGEYRDSPQLMQKALETAGKLEKEYRQGFLTKKT